MVSNEAYPAADSHRKVRRQHGLSFTSGHAIMSFSIAGLLLLVLPRRWGSPRLCWQRATGWRGCSWGHNPLDVVGGAAIGLAIAAVLDMILDVAHVRGRGPPGQDAPGAGGSGHLSLGKPPGEGPPDYHRHPLSTLTLNGWPGAGRLVKSGSRAVWRTAKTALADVHPAMAPTSRQVVTMAPPAASTAA